MTPRKRILFLCATYPPAPGGVAKHVADLAAAMTERDFDVHVVTNHIAHLPAEETQAGVRIKRISAAGSRVLRIVRFIVQSLAYIRHVRPDAIHSHELDLTSIVGLLAKLLFRIPLVSTLHTVGPLIGDIAKMQRSRLGLVRVWMFRTLVDRFVVISKALDAELTGIRVPSEKRVRIPNSVDMIRFCPADHETKCRLRRELSLPDGIITVAVGRLVWEKRIQNVLDVWPAIRSNFADATLLVIGGGEYEQDFRSRNVPGAIFLGEIPDVAPYLRASDLLVMVSEYEGFSLSTLEGLACGLSVVATPVGAVPELITHGENGWIVPIDDLPQLQTAILHLMEDSGIRSELGKQGHRRVFQDYSLKSTSQKLGALYQQLLPEKSRT